MRSSLHPTGELLANPANPAIATPNYMYAASPDGESYSVLRRRLRPLQLGSVHYVQNTPQFNNLPLSTLAVEKRRWCKVCSPI